MAQEAQMMTPFGADRTINGQVYITETSGFVVYGFHSANTSYFTPIIVVDLTVDRRNMSTPPGGTEQECIMTSQYIPDAIGIFPSSLIVEPAPSAGQVSQMRANAETGTIRNRAPKVNAIL